MTGVYKIIMIIKGSIMCSLTNYYCALMKTTLMIIKVSAFSFY